MAWLDHSRFHSPNRLILCVVWDVRGAVKEIVHAVASERLHDGAPIGSGDRFTVRSHGVRKTAIDRTECLHHFPDVPDQCSRLADADGSVQGLSGDTH